MNAEFEIVIDALVPSTLATFWAAALPGYQVRPYDQAEIERLRQLGLTIETDPSVALDGAGPTIWFQQSESVTEGRNRLHFDLKVDDRRAEQAKLESLGARVRQQRSDHTVMLDPEGNQFCVFERQAV